MIFDVRTYLQNLIRLNRTLCYMAIIGTIGRNCIKDLLTQSVLNLRRGEDRHSRLFFIIIN